MLIKATTLQSNPRTGTVKDKFDETYEQFTKLPSNMKSTLPFYAESAFVNFMFNKVLRFVYNSIHVDFCEIEGKPYYRFRFNVCGRKHTAILTPFAAYIVGKSVGLFASMGVNGDVLFDSPENAQVFVPHFSRRKVYNECKDICMQHRNLVEEQVKFLQAIVEPPQENNEEPQAPKEQVH